MALPIGFGSTKINESNRRAGLSSVVCLVMISTECCSSVWDVSGRGVNARAVPSARRCGGRRLPGEGVERRDLLGGEFEAVRGDVLLEPVDSLRAVDWDDVVAVREQPRERDCAGVAPASLAIASTWSTIARLR
jgi:hypothetical protein